MSWKITKTTENEIDAINNLIVEARKVWNYDSDYFDKTLHLITINTDSIKQNPSFTIKNRKSVIVGYFDFEDHDSQTYLERLYVKSDQHRMGIGRFAMEFVKNYCRKHGIKQLWLYPDPPAEPFYLKCGAEYQGKRVPSRTQGGPEFLQMKIEIDGGT